MTRITRWRRLAFLVAAAMTVAAAFTAFDVVPAASQASMLRAWSTEPSEALLQPWSASWSKVPAAVVALSAQNATKPFGGGEVATLSVRALQDGSRLYVLLEWKDRTRDTTVNGQTVFTDAAAVELPAVAGVAVPSFCMGDATGTVNIWHWKGVWQDDIDSGYTTQRDRYPDGFSDSHIFQTDPVYMTARAAGNLLAQPFHASPVENLVAASFGTLTTSELQDVDGRGEWKDGRWRVVFARDLKGEAGYPALQPGTTTDVAFAVWDGSKGNRDGIKSVSQFMRLFVSTASAPEAGGGVPWWALGIAALVVAAGAGPAAWAFLRRR